MTTKLNKIIKTIKLDRRNSYTVLSKLESEKRLEESGITDIPTVIPFRDTMGKLYVITHGVKTKYKNKLEELIKPKATLQAWKNTQEFRQYLENEGIVDCDEKINLICCYGGLINNPPYANINIVNTTSKPCYTYLERKDINGNYYTLTVGECQE